MIGIPVAPDLLIAVQADLQAARSGPDSRDAGHTLARAAGGAVHVAA